MSFETKITLELTFSVKFSVSPACPGSIEDGQKMEPDSPAEIEDIELELVRERKDSAGNMIYRHIPFDSDNGYALEQAIIEMHHDEIEEACMEAANEPDD